MRATSELELVQDLGPPMALAALSRVRPGEADGEPI